MVIKRSSSSLPILKYTVILMIGLSLCTCSSYATPLPSGISFFDNWVQGITGPGRWKGIQAVASDRMQVVTDSAQIGGYAVQVEVQPEDDPINSSGERAEAVLMTDSKGNYIDENESSGTQYYAFSIKLPPDWVPPANDIHGLHWGIFLQLHGPDTLGASPAFAFEVANAFSVDVTTGDLDTPAATYSHFYMPLSDGSLNLGNWVDFVIGIKFAKDYTGSITIWRRNEGATQFSQALSLLNIPTLQYRSSLGGVGDHYWKYGYYRSNQTTITSILDLGAIARGTTFNSVVTTVFR